MGYRVQNKVIELTRPQSSSYRAQGEMGTEKGNASSSLPLCRVAAVFSYEDDWGGVRL